MLSKKYKITKKKDFENIFRQGASFKEGNLILKTNHNSFGINRFALIVSQKVSKKATVRNRIRRQLKELIRPQARNMKKGMDCLFIVLPGLEKENFQGLAKILNNLFKKAGIINEIL